MATGARRGGLAGALDSVRRRGEAGLERGLAAPEAALLRGMVLGEDERLTEEVRDEFQRSGLAHILAVSGANVMLLAVLVLGACALFGVPLRARLVLAAALIVVYVPLAGGGPSIQRAGVMGVAGLVAALAGRPARRWYALLLAAAVTLVLNPRAAGEPGWQLSFAAVVALLVGAPPLREVLARRMPAAVADAAAITIAATIGTAPLMALYFEQVSLASLPANLLAAPAIAPIMWLGVLAAAARADRRAAGRAVHGPRGAVARLRPARRPPHRGGTVRGRRGHRLAARDRRRVGRPRRRCGTCAAPPDAAGRGDDRWSSWRPSAPSRSSSLRAAVPRSRPRTRSWCRSLTSARATRR